MKEYFPVYDRKNELYFVKDKLPNNQTIIMSFENYDNSYDTDYWNIALCVVNKRKHIDRVFDNCEITGEDPFATVRIARDMFTALESQIIQDANIYRTKQHVSCTWLDTKRRDVYAHFLKRRGYQYGMFDGKKVLYKVYKGSDVD